MITTFSKIVNKPNDYWVCDNCTALNLQENKTCATCESTKPDIPSENMKVRVLSWVDTEMLFYKVNYNYTDDDCDNIEIPI